MILAKNFTSTIFPNLLKDPNEKSTEICDVKIQNIYIFVFGLLQAILGLTLSLVYGLEDI